MKDDIVLNNISKKVAIEFKEEFKEDIDEEKILEIFHSQFKVLKEACKNEHEVKVYGLGSFAIKNGRKEYIEYSKRAKEMGLKTNEERKAMENTIVFNNPIKGFNDNKIEE